MIHSSILDESTVVMTVLLPSIKLCDSVVDSSYHDTEYQALISERPVQWVMSSLGSLGRNYIIFLTRELISNTDFVELSHCQQPVPMIFTYLVARPQCTLSRLNRH